MSVKNIENEKFFKTFFGLVKISNKNPLNKLIKALSDHENIQPIANLDFKFILGLPNKTPLKIKTETIVFYGSIISALSCKFFSSALQETSFEKIQKFTSNNFENHKQSETYKRKDSEPNLNDIKPVKSFLKIITNFFEKIINLFKSEDKIVYNNFFNSLRNPKDYCDNKITKTGFDKIIDVEIFDNDLIKIYANKIKKYKIKIALSDTNSCPESDNYQSAFLALYKYLLQEKEELLKLKNENKIVKKELKKLNKFSIEEFEELKNKFFKQYQNINKSVA